MKFNEDSRVKIPTILHLMKLGYEYLPLSSATWDTDTNIFTDIFYDSVMRINQGLEKDEAKRLFDDIKLVLDNEDLGRTFFEKLIARSGTKLIDFENFNNNSFHVVTELTYKNGDEEFRPDIILLINGMPLVFVEVKKPNNRDGVIDERNRINKRFSNPKFRRFVNMTQFMIFSNNMPYADGDPEPIQGAFYASSSYHKPIFNYFREEEVFNYTALLKPISQEQELAVLKDNNLAVIHNSPEFQLNKQPERPTNSICTSLLSRERLAFVLRYALAYVNETKGIEKHIMRYPQIFATKAIANTLDQGIKKGIIWHTQGSGKTALAYYNVAHLTDYFQKQNITPKFYFIVDRLDLLQQAQSEFTARGLRVKTVSSRDEFARDIKATKAIHNDAGEPEITVVNIQKFENDPNVTATKDYNVDIQRVYFLDEVHRSYNPKGSFLANLKESDPNAIKIGLTGTPLLGDDYNSRALFGDYIHKYYYNASIADGYTLRLIREEISTNYKLILQEALAKAQVLVGDVKREKIYAHSCFVDPMLKYIVEDFENSRGALADASIGGMVICDSAPQAKQMYEIFNKLYAQGEAITDNQTSNSNAKTLAEIRHEEIKVKSAQLILHDVGTKEDRKEWVEDFKAGKTDFLFVYNMLLTGFDAKRLKKLYIGRVIRKHNLLQALTRVNRTYKDFRYGYVVDFADISKEFEETNKAYFKELQSELGDELEHYSNLFKTQEEIHEEIAQVKEVLFEYNTNNMEVFSDQISQIQDLGQMRALKKVLANARSLYNLIRLQGEYEILESLDFQKLNVLYREASHHLDLLNTKQNLEQGIATSNLLNQALEDVIFKFTKIGEEELVLADELKSTLRKTREAMTDNFDPKDPEFISLKEELERIFKKRKLSEVSQEQMNANIDELTKIHNRIKELNRKNTNLSQKYGGDTKYARIHKRLREQEQQSPNKKLSEYKLHEILAQIKDDADEKVLNSNQIVEHGDYFEKQMMPIVIKRFNKDASQDKIKLNNDSVRYVSKLVVNEYTNEYYTGARAC
ncbi:type I restriction endonuclease subunit R [Psychrobacter sp.]|uniref:type I restriction endonuclease subunit R n=1 Tax=Psychrobacter sp. TaxID=56811 RepID=UPI003BAE2219